MAALAGVGGVCIEPFLLHPALVELTEPRLLLHLVVNRRGRQDGASWSPEYDTFLHEKLMASMPIEGGFAGQPEERGAEIVNLLKA